MTRSARLLIRPRTAGCEAPEPELDLVPGPSVAGASLGTPEGQAARFDAERAELLERIAAASIPSRAVALLLLDVYGLDCLTTPCLRRMTAVLDAAGVGGGQ